MMKKILLTSILSMVLVGCQKAESPQAIALDASKVAEIQVTEDSKPQETQAPEAQVTANLEREKRMAAEVEDAILDGEPVYLRDGEHEFLAIDTEPESDAKGAVLILHGRGFHPNWQDAIYPLRTGLPAHGWRTLSLQMPVLEKSAKYYDYEPLFPQSFPRIEAGIEYLKQQGVENIVLLAHSCGAHMAMEWIAAKGDSAITAYIGAGMGATDYKQPMRKPFPLAQMKVPVLDVFGMDEYPGVLAKSAQRLSMIGVAGNSKSRQIPIPNANHYFTDAGDPLVKVVAEWLAGLE